MPQPVRPTLPSLSSRLGQHAHLCTRPTDQDVLLILEGISNRLNHLTRSVLFPRALPLYLADTRTVRRNSHQIRVLISLALFPQLFKPPEQHTATHFSSRTAAHSTSALPRTALLATSDDPLAPTHRHLREAACALLADALDALGGAELVGEAVAGYGMPSRDDVGSSSLASAAALDDSGDTPARKKLKPASLKGKGKARAAGARPDGDDDDAHEGDDALSLAANRILSDAADLWDVLGGTTARRERVRSARNPVLEVGGWDLVAVLVAAWEHEAERKAAAARVQGVGASSFSLASAARPCDPLVLTRPTPLSLPARRPARAAQPPAPVQAERFDERRPSAVAQGPRRRLLAVRARLRLGRRRGRRGRGRGVGERGRERSGSEEGQGRGRAGGQGARRGRRDEPRGQASSRRPVAQARASPLSPRPLLSPRRARSEALSCARRSATRRCTGTSTASRACRTSCSA